MKIFYLIPVLLLITFSRLPAQRESFYEISRLPFTSNNHDEFAPSYYNQGIVFTTNKSEGFLISRLTTEGENLFNIYYTDQRSPGNWRNPGMFSKNLSSNYHDGPVSFSAGGSLIFFTRNIPGKRNELSNLGIFIADNSSGEWVNIRPFPHNGNDYNVTHPSISEDGKVLYFASDIPGGYGGMDLYVSRYDGSDWSQPENLGPTVNSEFDEVFPYIHPGGRLYYSSRNSTNGSLDLHYSKKSDDEWRRPVRLPEPLNSESDDFGFIADRDLKTGYFSSGREGTDNIYSFRSTFPVFAECDSIRDPVLCYVFFEESAAEIDTTLLYFEWDMGDGTRIRGLEADHCFEGTGNYTVRLDVIDMVTGEMQYNVAWFPFTIDRIEQPYITSPDTVKAGNAVVFDASETYLPNFEGGDYFWETGDGVQYEGETISHYYSSPGIYQVRLGVLPVISSPTDQQKACVYKFIVVTEDEDVPD